LHGVIFILGAFLFGRVASMAVEISPNGAFGVSVSLEGADAARFVGEVAEPSKDRRRLIHLERSDRAFEEFFSPEPVSSLPTVD
jgi:hypothetical protein